MNLVRGFSVEDAGHAANAAVSSRNLLELERRHVDRKLLELALVGEELVGLLEPQQVLSRFFQQITIAVWVSQRFSLQVSQDFLHHFLNLDGEDAVVFYAEEV